jgi:nitrite reductase/ring-hydroxylating ferredoxin subunit
MMTNIRVANRDELPPGKGKVVEVGERRVTIYNLDGRFHATATRRARPHNPIAETDCSLHGHVFDVYAEDSPARVRAETEVYAVRLRGGTIWLELPDE